MITPFLLIIRSSAQKDKYQSEKVKNKEKRMRYCSLSRKTLAVLLRKKVTRMPMEFVYIICIFLPYFIFIFGKKLVIMIHFYSILCYNLFTSYNMHKSDV